MFNPHRLTAALMTIAATLVLAGCGTRTLSQVHDGKTDQPVWPDAAKVHPLIPQTMHPELATLAKVVPGAAKLEVYRLIGHPMYREGTVGVHEWDYLFKLPSGEPGKYVDCQYKLLWNDEMRLTQTWWNPELCAALAGVPAPGEPVAPQEPHVAAATEISADTLFDFDSARLAADAPEAIDQQVLKVLDAAERVETLRLIGYADRLGSAGYNLDLSRRRAESVKAYLVAKGVPGEAIDTEGRGSSDPVVQCNDRNRRALIDCLKPNRRVRVEVIAR
ncbi:OmpA family protein [Lysobacter arenosi]|uniref:OmpA family protein n=1 Tax=Lysobacter arenosi TaxID=2795387 RepID=A0ABX7RBC1_9GAMM|nr:OmpA family protein [Lysobacter arenosi]QSX74701.1 OmpA family protein [Lysobacter arenosi]